MFLHKRQLHMIFAALGLLLAACKEEKIGPLPHTGSGIPLQVDHLQVENIHGGANITYVVPEDPNLLYVEAEWTDKGVNRNTKASYYSDTLHLEGFGDTSMHTVTIYSVNKNDQKSAAQTISIKPLTPPVWEVFKTLTVRPDFGGINVGFENDTHADIVISVLTNDSIGKLGVANALYTRLQRDSFSTRGYDSTARVFGLFVKDRWNNHSDTLFTTQKPLFELQLNKSLFKEVNPYPGDINNNLYSTAYPMSKIWDGNTGTIYVTASTLVLPESFTINLGVTAKFSRIKFNQRQSTAFYFASGSPRVFQIYGSNSPAADGNWDSWTLLQTCTSVKPSGLPLGTLSNDDISYAAAGEDYNFPIDAGAYRYLRFKILNTWGNSGGVTFSEITLWGAY
ncbi:DUF5000 domain-containing lipoprotein [Chitinophaga parva]|nr:DUF5000 domain-containing lipoprotein [Chitinophaga parva]